MATAQEPGFPTLPGTGPTISKYPGSPTSLEVGIPISQGTKNNTSQKPRTVTSLEPGIVTSQRPGSHISVEPIVKKEERFIFLLTTTLNILALPLMKEIYNQATGPRNTGECFENHIIRITGMTEEDYKAKFNPEIRDLIANDPYMDSFDITSLFIILQHGCSSFAPANDKAWLSSGTLENNLKRIKDFRNNLIHPNLYMSEAEFYNKLEEQRILLVNTALLAKSKFSIDEEIVTRMIRQFHAKINDTRDSPFEANYFVSLDVTPLINSLKREGIHELKEALRESSIVNLASLITGRNLPMEVAEIFTPLRIIDGIGGNTDDTVSLDDLLIVANDKKKYIILLEGIAGVGKTTIIKKIISDWLKGGNRTMKDINTYDFIIPVQCRDRGYKSIGRIASAFIPEARKRFRKDEHMVTCLLACKTLFILDGLDEVTDDSKHVLTELLEMFEREKFIIILTTRPEKIQEIYQMIPSGQSNILHLRIDGVEEIHRDNFITKYHTKLKNLGVSSKCNANGLLTYLQTTGACLQDQWTLPINLTLVTFLWGIDDDRILYITCPIELSIVIRNMTRVRLEERVVHKIGYTLRVFDRKIKAFISLLSEIALHGIRDSDLLIPENNILRLYQICTDSNLPSQELFGAFLEQKSSWLSTYMFAFPHKSEQEFYAAMHIYNQVLGMLPVKQKNEEKLKKVYALLSRHGVANCVLQEVTELINEEKAKGMTITEVLAEINRKVTNPPSMVTYQNTLTSLLGILHYTKATDHQEVANEMVNLLKDVGVKEPHQWIKVLNNVKCDPVFARTLIIAVPTLLGNKEGQDVDITDRDVFAYATLLQYKRPRMVNVFIKENPSDIPRLEEMFETLSKGSIHIKNLYLDHLFRHPNRKFRSCLNALLDKCPIKRSYRGPLPSRRRGEGEESHHGLFMVKGLRETEILEIPLFNGKDAQLLFSFLRWREIARSCSLKELVISFGKDITASHLPWNLSAWNVVGGFVDVFFPDVEGSPDDEERVIRILRTFDRLIKLFGGFVDVFLPDVEGSPDDEERVVRILRTFDRLIKLFGGFVDVFLPDVEGSTDDEERVVRILRTFDRLIKLFGGFVDVFLPDVEGSPDDEERVVRNLRTFDREFSYLLFPRYQKNPPVSPGIPRVGERGASFKRFLRGLRGIQVESVSFPSRCRPSEDRDRENVEWDGYRMLGAKSLFWSSDGGTGIWDMNSWE